MLSERDAGTPEGPEADEMAAANRNKYAKLLKWLLDEYEKFPESVQEQFRDGGWVIRNSLECAPSPT